MEGEEPQTRGYRVYLIREALGTRRDPMPMQAFAELIAKVSGVSYDKSTLSRLETGERKLSLEDIDAIAPIDPLKRGRSWLAWGDPPEGQQGAHRNGNPGPLIGPTIRTHVQSEVSRLDDPTPARKENPKRRPPRDRTAMAG
jgi:transcriptional regulator with XRE-family HTH domain